MAMFSVLQRVVALKRELITKGADPDKLALVMSDESYHKLHAACQQRTNKEILILEQFEDMEIIVHPLCSDDVMHIIDMRYFKP